MIEAVAFDFDGVLVGIDAHTQARIQAFEEFAESRADERFIASPHTHHDAHLHGSHTDAIIGWVLQYQGLVARDINPADAELTKLLADRKREIYHALVSKGRDALDGSVECVRWALETFGSERVAIVTTASKTEVEPFLMRYDLIGKVGCLISRELVGKDLKPHPLAYNLASKYFRLKPQNCAAIEDSVRGLKSAESAGYYTIGITTTHSFSRLKNHARRVVASHGEIPPLIASMR
jgi:beta-phosphoglucomutase